jgi:DNA-binding TFAR19-related protein (PDSD5 family)
MISEYDQFKEQVLNNILDLNAKDRLSRIALVKPERAVQIENYLVTVHKYK